MNILEALYRLNPSDVQSRLLAPLQRRAQADVASATVGAFNLVVPSDECWILHHWHHRADGGGAQLALSHSLALLPPPYTLSQFLFIEEFAGVAISHRNIHFGGGILVPGGWAIQDSATFNGAAVANTVICTLSGVIFPRGNIERS